MHRNRLEQELEQMKKNEENLNAQVINLKLQLETYEHNS